MSDKQVKQLRSQLRAIVKEILPEILTQELIKAIDEENIQRIRKIEAEARAVMQHMNERHKDTMGYLVRQVTVPTETKKDE